MAKEPDKKTKRPTAKKRDIQNQKRRLVNKSFKSKIKTALRSFEESLSTHEKEPMQSGLTQVYSLMDKAVKRGVFKKNKANRLKSRASKRVAAQAS